MAKRTTKAAAPVIEEEEVDAVTEETVGTEGTEGDAPDAPPSSPAPTFVLKQRITIGGRGAKKAADGTVVTPAEPTVELFKGEVDLSGLVASTDIGTEEEGNVTVPRALFNFAVPFLLDAAAKVIRADQREAFEAAVAACDGDTEAKGKAAAEAVTVADAETFAIAISRVLSSAPDPFAPKPKADRKAAAAATKAKVQELEGKTAKMGQLAQAVGEAMAAGDLELAQKLQAELVALASS